MFSRTCLELNARSGNLHLRPSDRQQNEAGAPHVIALKNLDLVADRGDTIVTFQKGLTLRFQALGPQQYQILIDGPILDDGTQYTLTGKVIAVFERCPVPPAPAAQ